jgi:hypothetical protein
MAKVKITGHASGSGVITVTAPNTSTDRTITLPDATGTLATTAEAFNPDAAQVFNESGADVDFRVESDNLTHALFVQGSDGNVGLGTTTPPERLSIHEPSTGTGTYLPVAITGSNHATGYGVGISFKTENTSPAQKAKAAIIAEGTGEGYNKTSLHIAMSNTGDTTTEVALANSVLEFTMDGRGLSQFTAKAWCCFNGTGTLAVKDSHNVSSVSDIGTGAYNVNWDVNMTNANYSGWANCPKPAGSASTSNSSNGGMMGESTTSLALVLTTQADGTTAKDLPECQVGVFGD